MNNILSKSKEYDLLFLDVEMPGMTGIEMADACLLYTSRCV